MMGKMRWMTGSLVGLALLTGSVAPAQARPRYDHGGWDHHRHDRGNGFNFGDAVGIAALLGAVAVVATSVSKDKQATPAPRPYGDTGDRPYVEADAPPPANGTDYGADVRDGATPARNDDFSDVALTGQNNDQMTDACALAARNEAQDKAGGYAEVRHIEEPRAANGGYNIDGEVESRASYRATDSTTRRFTCTVKDGRVAEVYLSRDVAMH